MSPEHRGEEIPASSHNKAALLLAPLPLDFHMTPQFVCFTTPCLTVRVP